MTRAAVEDPLKVFRYRVLLGNGVRAGFSKCSALEATVEIDKYREGGMAETPQKSPGQVDYADLTLERGQIVGSNRVDADALITWFRQVVAVAGGSAANFRRDVIIEQYDATNTLARKWKVKNAFPKNHKAFSELDANNMNGHSVESLVLVHEGYEPVL